MNHADVRARMADYLEGQLDLTSRALLDAHLDGCPECARDVAEMRATIAVLRGLPEPQVPGDFSANVMRRIRAGESKVTLFDRLSDLFESITSPRILAPASAALLSAGFVFWGQQVGLLDVGGASMQSEAPTVVLDETEAAVAKASAAPQRPAAARVATTESAAAFDGGGIQLAGVAPSPAAPPAGADAPAPVGVVHLTIALQAAPPYRIDAQGPAVPFQIDPRRSAPIPFRSEWREADLGQSLAVASAPGPALGDVGSLDAGMRRTLARSPARYGIAAEAAASEPRSRDDWLAILERNPAEFAEQLSRLSLAEQELWVDRLARHAAEQGSLDRVVERLRDAGGDVGELLADDFAAVGTAASAQ